MISKAFRLLSILCMWLPLALLVAPAAPAQPVCAESEEAPVSEPKSSVETLPSCRVSATARRASVAAPPRWASLSVESLLPLSAPDVGCVFDGHRLANGLMAPLLI